MDSEIYFKYNIRMESCSIEAITQMLKELIPLFIREVIAIILTNFAEHSLKEGILPHSCCNQDFIWSHKRGKESTLQTQWGAIKIPQLQVKCRNCGGQKSLARPLLEMKARSKISTNLKENIALFSSLMPYRICQKVLQFSGIKMSRSQNWRNVQEVGSSIEFKLHPDGLNSGMADGTGVGIQGIKKRGKELKVFAQNTPKGGIHIAGVNIGSYENEQNWKEIFEPLKEDFEKRGEFSLTLDGDCSIIKGFDANITLNIQRCLWHIPHQIKYYLWVDGIKHKSEDWLKIMSKVIYFVSLPKQKIDDPDILEKILKNKKLEYGNLIELLRGLKAFSCLHHLENAYPKMFTNFAKGLEGKTTSLIERVMRTVNLRTNVGKWSTKGALNLLKIRLAHYYNGFQPKEKGSYFKLSKIT